MAENQDAPKFGNFSIEDTIEMGMGNQELLQDLLAPETQTSSPDDIKEIKEAPPAAAPAASPQKKEAPVEQEKVDAQKAISDFLFNEDKEEEDEEEEQQPVKQKAVKQSVAEEKPAEQQEETQEGEEELSRFTALSRDLFKLGVFSKDDEEEEDMDIKTPEEFLERFQLEKKKGAIEVVNNFIGQFGEDYQKAFDAIFVKGVDPKDYFQAFNTIQSFAEMDLSKENNQVAVIRQALEDQGFEAEDIDTEVERLKNYGDLESVATKHHKVLVKKEAVKLQEIEEQKQLQLQQQAYIKNQYIQNVQTILQDKLKTKEFDGIPINPKLAGELQDFLLVDKYKTNSGETLTDFDRTILELKRPENHEMKVKVALLLKILERDPTLSTIQKTGITKKSNELFGEVARQASKASVKSSGGNKQVKPNSWFL